MSRKHLTGTRLGLVLAVLLGVVLGAVFGRPSTGRAASAAAPTNTKPPVVNGTAEVGQTVATTRGSWTGNPGSYSFAWSRCDTTGAACATIGGATSRSYTVQPADQGHTLRSTVTAHNSSGNGTATSAASAVVPPSGCPTGSGVIQITQLAAPARLEISSAVLTPAVTRASRTIHLRVQATACYGRPVQGATIFATPIPYNQFAGAQGTTGADGIVTLTEARRSGFPAARRQHLLTVFARASKQGEPAFGGVSSSRVVTFHIAHS